MTDVKALVKKFNKDFKRDVEKLSGGDPSRIGTDIFAFDLATGGGFPTGRCSIVFGPESSMKSTICLKALGKAQRQYPNLTHVFVDVEGTYDKKWAAHMGVDSEKLLVLVPANAEEVVNMVTNLLYAEDIGVIVVDSLAAMISQREVDSDAEDAMVGVAGILINKLYRKITLALNVVLNDPDVKSIPTIILINQIRFKIGVMYGNPETMPGGPSFMYAGSLIVRVYGKDEMDKNVHKSLPAFKKVSMVVKKWKVPIVAKNAEFLIALQDNDLMELSVGETYDWPTVLAYLKSLELLKKEKAGWTLLGETYKTQESIKAKMVEEPSFEDAIRNTIIEMVIEGLGD